MYTMGLSQTNTFRSREGVYNAPPPFKGELLKPAQFVAKLIYNLGKEGGGYHTYTTLVRYVEHTQFRQKCRKYSKLSNKHH